MLHSLLAAPPGTANQCLRSRARYHMAQGVVVAHEPELGNALRVHQKDTPTAVAKAIGEIRQYDFGGWYDQRRSYAGHVYFVPGDTMVRDEALRLGIRSPDGPNAPAKKRRTRT